MRLRGFTKPWLYVFVFLLGALLAVGAACGDDDDDDGDSGGTATPTSAGDGIDISGVSELDDGELLIGSDIAYPPIESFEEGTDKPVGLDIDIAQALAAELGVDVKFEQVADFAGIVGDLKSKRYDIVMSAISITPEREAEIGFVPYFGPVGTGILVQKGNPEGIETLEDLCGRKVAAQVGTYQVEQMDALNADTCKDNQIDIQTFPDNPAAVQELTLGRVVAELADDPVAAYSASQSGGDLEVAATGFESATYGIGVRKDSTALKAALGAAFQVIVDSGKYADILDDWGQTEFALKD